MFFFMRRRLTATSLSGTCCVCACIYIRVCVCVCVCAHGCVHMFFFYESSFNGDISKWDVLCVCMVGPDSVAKRVLG